MTERAPARAASPRPGEPDGERLQKVLARAGFGSRRVCEEIIDAGRVTIGGHVAVLGDRVRDRDRVELDGVLVPTAPGLVYYLLNKPAGVLSAASDSRGREVVTDLVPSEPRVYPVGRLDLATEGLILLTNDGDLANAVAHPSHGVDKEYLVELDTPPSAGALRSLRQGVELDDGRTAPAKVGAVAPGVIRIVIHEGRNRQIRRMCEAVGHRVRRLVRTRIGPIADSSLKPGAWRALRGDEVRALLVAAKR